MGRRIPTILVALTLAAGAARADIGGRVLVEGSGSPGDPVPGAWVHLQGVPAPGVFAGADGSFLLDVDPAGAVMVTASLPYAKNAPENFLVGGAFAVNGDLAVEIRLTPLPLTDQPGYEPPTSGVCAGCHPQQAADWQTSRHANTASNAWVLDLFSGTGTPGGGAGYVFKATHDPGETGFCATCHAPLADLLAGGTLELDDPAMPAYGAEGVVCVACHQLADVDAGAIDALHFRGKATYRFPASPDADTYTFVWGPLDDVTFGGMRPSHSPLHRSSLLCASCHQYRNPETGAPGQNTYGEWLASPFAQPGPGLRTCQDCHMPASEGSGTICLFGGVDRPGGDRKHHTFVGSTPATMTANVGFEATAEQVDGGRLRVTTAVDNFGAGHDFPTGVGIRNVIVLVEASIAGAPLAQVAGPTVPWWADDEVPGKQPGDWAGLPGTGYAKVLEGRINGQGPVVRPVLFVDAEGVAENTQIHSGTVATAELEFALPAGIAAGTPVDVTARLVWRRAWRSVAVTKGWTADIRGGPIEVELHRVDLALPLDAISPLEIPALAPAGLALLAAGLAAAGLGRLRRRDGAR
jgi:hypothetical protein